MRSRRILGAVLGLIALAALAYLAYSLWFAAPSGGPTLLYFRSDT
jgi:hypothetical protein